MSQSREIDLSNDPKTKVVRPTAWPQRISLNIGLFYVIRHVWHLSSIHMGCFAFNIIGRSYFQTTRTQLFEVCTCADRVLAIESGMMSREKTQHTPLSFVATNTAFCSLISNRVACSLSTRNCGFSNRLWTQMNSFILCCCKSQKRCAARTSRTWADRS